MTTKMNFVDVVGPLDANNPEQLVLRTLLKHKNLGLAPMVIKEIRNEIIGDIATDNRKLIETYESYSTEGIDAEIQRLQKLKATKERSSSLKKNLFNKRSIKELAYNSLQAASFPPMLYRLFKTDEELLELGFAPKTTAQKAEVFEDVLRILFDKKIPAWETIAKALKNMEKKKPISWVICRKVQGGRSEDYYEASPQLLELWRHQKSKSKSMGKAGKFWFG